MSIDFFRKLNWLFGLMLLGILFGVISFSATLEIKDLDLWLHLKMGEYITTHGYVPRVDVLSASFAGKPWIDHEWLFQVFLHGVRSLWGLDGLIYMQSGVVFSTLLLLLLLVYDKDRQLIHAALLYLVMEVYQTRFTIRPDIFSLFFFVLYILIISSALRRWWSVPLLFMLQVVWSNMHGYSLWGIVMVLIAAFAECVRRRVRLPYEWNQTGRLTDKEYRRLGLALLAVMAATFITPLGVQGALYPLRTLAGMGDAGSRIFFEHITELQRPLSSWKALFDFDSQWSFKALVFLSFLSFFINRRRVDIGVLLLWAVFLFFSLTAVRNISYFAFAAFLVIAHNISRLTLEDVVPFRAVHEKFVHLTGVVIAILMMLRLVNHANDISLNGYYDFDRYERKSEFLGVSQRNFPGKAAAFLKSAGIRGNFFNDFNSGAYLIGNLYPQVMVFMDGRTELRGGAFFKMYDKIWNNGDGNLFDDVVKRYALTGAFVNTAAAPGPAKFLKMIAARPAWVPVYFDYDAVIFLKDVPVNAASIARYRLDLGNWKPRELDLEVLGATRVVPYRNIRRAKTLKGLGFTDAAFAEAQAALKILPAYDEAYKILGDIAAARGQYQKAFEYFRLACAYDSDNAQYRKDFAMAYLSIGNPKKSLEQADEAVSLDPSDKEARYILAKALVENKQYQKGYDILMRITPQEQAEAGLTNKIHVLVNAIKGARDNAKE